MCEKSAVRELETGRGSLPAIPVPGNRGVVAWESASSHDKAAARPMLLRMTLRQAFGVFFKGSLGLLSIWMSPVGQAAEDGLERMKSLVRERFPEVPHLTTVELAAWLADPKRIRPVLLDVRTRAEFDVSHIPGARQVDPEVPAADLLPTLPKGAPIVLYCSVGYRSADCGTRLLKAGFTNLLNLEGSLFQWANEGRPLESAGHPATQVHPYSAKFGKLLKPELRAPVTPRTP